VQLFKAACAAGDAEALAVASLCAEAGVKILGSAKAGAQMKANETMAVEALRRLSREKRGLGLVLLRAILAQAQDGSNVLRLTIIDALRLVLLDHRDWWRDERAFVAALSQLDLDLEWRAAMARKAQERGLSAVDALYARLVGKLEPLMKGAAA
jgi:hypothetical protein